MTTDERERERDWYRYDNWRFAIFGAVLVALAVVEACHATRNSEPPEPGATHEQRD